MRQSQHANVLGFEKLSRRYDEVILRFLLALSASEQEALELCCATFVAAYHGLARREYASLYIWLYRLAARQWLERATKRGAGSQPLQAEVLSPREWLVFTLKVRQHLELRTAAQILDEPQETVARIFSRAVCKLQMSARTAA